MGHLGISSAIAVNPKVPASILNVTRQKTASQNASSVVKSAICLGALNTLCAAGQFFGLRFLWQKPFNPEYESCKGSGIWGGITFASAIASGGHLYI
ncbi:hypothetical protein ILT44_28300 [Microvirga sp. BT689]|uniref:hypothetical protein n=1 Tax=Microvirga arvi TaxID=2778731 RepID=UPI00194DC221|nr:hypothetical protein [Microvirga arvi]MBM6584104.1 hypothetical protein [Microvirga arvi]